MCARQSGRGSDQPDRGDLGGALAEGVDAVIGLANGSFVKWVPLASLALVLIGCGSPVRVIDEAGRPITGARVQPVSLSVNGAWETTDKDGHVSVPTSISVQDVKW